MRGWSGTARHGWPVVLALLAMACASTSRLPESAFSREYFTSRNGHLRYKLPGGWLNATSDSSSPSNIIWLVRADFGATLAVNEVSVDEGAKLEIDRSGLKRVAELTLALAAAEGAVTTMMAPAESLLRGVEVCTYEYNTDQSGDRIRVMLLDAGTRVYAVRMLTIAKAPNASIVENALIQEDFVRMLVW